MTTDDLIKYYGTAGDAQREVGVSRQLFGIWKEKGIPKGRQFEIHFRTGGKLKIDPKMKMAL